jgi:hypothetical protein
VRAADVQLGQLRELDTAEAAGVGQCKGHIPAGGREQNRASGRCVSVDGSSRSTGVSTLGVTPAGADDALHQCNCSGLSPCI